jgi:hypothetical protein
VAQQVIFLIHARHLPVELSLQVIFLGGRFTQDLLLPSLGQNILLCQFNLRLKQWVELQLGFE